MTQKKSYWESMERKYGHLGDRAKCRVCGKVYKFLGAHLKAHYMSEMEYKDKFNIFHSLPLCVEDISNALSDSMGKRIESGSYKTSEKFFASSRMTGKHVPPRAKNEFRKRMLEPEIIKKRNESALPYLRNKTKSHIKNISVSLSDSWKKKHPLVKCSFCGKEFHLSAKKKNTMKPFCERECFTKYMRENGSVWVKHTRLTKRAPDAAKWSGHYETCPANQGGTCTCGY